MLAVLIVWVLVATLAAVMLGRAIRIAERRSPGTGAPLTTADLPRSFTRVPV